MWAGGGGIMTYLVGDLCPVNQKGLYQGLKQTSVCLLVILHTSQQTTNSLKSTNSVLTQTYIRQKVGHTNATFSKSSVTKPAVFVRMTDWPPLSSKTISAKNVHAVFIVSY